MKAGRLFVVLLLACAICALADAGWYPISDDEEYLLTLLSSEDSRERLQVLTALGSAATERSVPVLVEMLETADLREACSIVEVLGNVGDSRAAPVILRRLEETLETYAPPPPPPDTTGLSDVEAWEILKAQTPEPDVSFLPSQLIQEACMALGRVSPEDALAVLPGIIDARTNHLFTYSAFLGLGYMRDDRAVPIVVDGLVSCSDSYEIRGVVDALVLIDSPAATDALYDLITDPMTPHRAEVISEAGYVTHDDLFSYGVERVLDGEKVRILKETIREVGRGDPDPQYRLLALMTVSVFFTNTDEETAELNDSIEALVGTYPISLYVEYEPVFENFKHREPELAGRLLVGALEKTTDKEGILRILNEIENLIPRGDTHRPPTNLWDILIGLTKDEEAEIRGVCLRLLARMYGIDAAPYVLDAFDDPSPGVRWEAADVYASYRLRDADWDAVRRQLAGEHRESAYDFILDAALREENHQVYEVMVKALISTRDPRAVEVLTGIFEDAAPDDRNTRLAMIQMLAGMGLAEADAAVARLAQTEEELNYVRAREAYTPRVQDMNSPEPLREVIENPDARDRGRAARKYAGLVGPEAMDVILDYLPTEDDPEQRLQAYIGLEDLNRPVPLDRLLPLLEAEDNPWTLSYILPLVPDEHDEGAAAVLARKIEAEYGPRVDGSHPMFLPENASSSSANDYEFGDFNRAYDALMRKLVKIAPETAYPILERIYRNDPVEQTRATAYGLALGTGQPGAVELLREGLESPEAGVRYHAVKAAPGLLGDEGVDIVAAAVNDPGFEVKLAAIKLIAEFRGPDAADIIAPQLESPNNTIRETAGSRLADWGDPRAFDYFYGLWNGQIVHKETYSVITNLAKYDDPRAWEVIREVSELGGRANEVRDAWLLRAERGDPEAREFFLSIIDEEESRFTLPEAPFLGLLWFEDDEVRAVIERIAADETQDQYRRYYAWGVLAFWKDPRARGYWLECLNDKENSFRYFSLAYLSYFDDPEVWELIRDAAENDPDKLVRSKARQQLEKREGE
jgi:HEAT repeat protein